MYSVHTYKPELTQHGAHLHTDKTQSYQNPEPHLECLWNSAFRQYVMAYIG
jgi:hypothetical protein